jgi:hypothetical protein
MVDSIRSAADAGLLSRRQAIAGALAVAAGALLATRPTRAMAANGDPVLAGQQVFASSGTTLYLNSPATIAGVEYAQAMINRNGITGNGPVAAFGGVAMPAAIAGSTGIWGDAWVAGHYGVHAQHENGAGVALKVQGKATFSRSGKATIAKGHSSRTVAGLNNIGTGSMILVTLQGSAGAGRYVRYAKRVSDTSFTVVLSSASASTVAFAWMIID